MCRWDINSIEKLPDYMKICFLGFYNSINEITYNTLTNTGFLILPYLQKAVTNPPSSPSLTSFCILYYVFFTPNLLFFLLGLVTIAVGRFMQVISTRGAVVPHWTYTNIGRILGQCLCINIGSSNSHAR